MSNDHPSSFRLHGQSAATGAPMHVRGGIGGSPARGPVASTSSPMRGGERTAGGGGGGGPQAIGLRRSGEGTSPVVGGVVSTGLLGTSVNNSGGNYSSGGASGESSNGPPGLAGMSTEIILFTS